MFKKIIKNQNAFTFPEALLVLGSVGLAIALVFFVIRPDFQFKRSRDIRRTKDIVEILDALDAYKAEKLGLIPEGIDSNLKMIGNSTENCTSGCGELNTNTCVNLENFISPTYIEAVPFDPLIGSNEKTFYAIRVNSEGRYEIRACTPEIEDAIVIMR